MKHPRAAEINWLELLPLNQRRRAPVPWENALAAAYIASYTLVNELQHQSSFIQLSISGEPLLISASKLIYINALTFIYCPLHGRDFWFIARAAIQPQCELFSNANCSTHKASLSAAKAEEGGRGSVAAELQTPKTKEARAQREIKFGDMGSHQWKTRDNSSCSFSAIYDYWFEHWEEKFINEGLDTGQFLALLWVIKIWIIYCSGIGWD